MEESPGGSRIYRHEERDPDEVDFSHGDDAVIAGVEAHLDRFFPDRGDDGLVYHEIVSTFVHVDVHVIPPGGDRPWITLVTSGMSERPMHVPDGLEDHAFAELVLALPPDWPLDEGEVSGGGGRTWPADLLRSLAPPRWSTSSSTSSSTGSTAAASASCWTSAARASSPTRPRPRRGRAGR